MTREMFLKLLNYNKETGVFTTKFKTQRTEVGAIAGYTHNGYVIIQIENKPYKAHRVAWLIEHGVVPCGEIDHINHNRSDNRICNLRDVANSENMKNKTQYKNNSSGVSGVSWRKSICKWTARISVDGERIILGSFVKFSDAVNARKNAEVMYGFHKNHGKDK